MKKILSVLIIVILGFSSYANTTLDNGKADKGKKKKSRSSSAALVQNVVEEDPIFAFAGDIASADNKVTVKVFDVSGKVVLEKKVSMESIFNSKTRLEVLPQNTVFVMFHQNIAYYFQEASVK